eukprot:1550578-Pyramimonas_sp.AAC.1
MISEQHLNLFTSGGLGKHRFGLLVKLGNRRFGTKRGQRARASNLGQAAGTDEPARQELVPLAAE